MLNLNLNPPPTLTYHLETLKSFQHAQFDAQFVLLAFLQSRFGWIFGKVLVRVVYLEELNIKILMATSC